MFRTSLTIQGVFGHFTSFQVRGGVRSGYGRHGDLPMKTSFTIFVLKEERRIHSFTLSFKIQSCKIFILFLVILGIGDVRERRRRYCFPL